MKREMTEEQKRLQGNNPIPNYPISDIKSAEEPDCDPEEDEKDGSMDHSWEMTDPE